METAIDPRMTPGSVAAQRDLAAALTVFHNRRGDPFGILLPRVAEEPDFLFGHLFLGAGLTLSSERRFRALGHAHLRHAAALATSDHPREYALSQALAPLLHDDWAGAGHALDLYLADFPADAFALQTGQMIDFFRGDAINLRNRIARALPAWDSGMPYYSHVLAMHAFGLEECHEYAAAEATAAAALDIEPLDGWAVHVIAHVMEMQGRTDEGIDWLTGCFDQWAASDPPVGFACHNAWHLALMHLDREDDSACLEVLDRWITPGIGDFAYGLADVTALLARLTLFGVDVGSRFETNARGWLDKLSTEAGYYAFNDFHAALAFAATGRAEALDELVRAAREATRGSGISASTAAVGLPLLEAVQDRAAGRHAEAAARLIGLRDQVHAFGGSHAQRDLVTLLLIDSCARAGKRSRARHWLNERLLRRPESGIGRRLRAMIDRAGH